MMEDIMMMMDLCFHQSTSDQFQQKLQVLLTCVNDIVHETSGLYPDPKTELSIVDWTRNIDYDKIASNLKTLQYAVSTLEDFCVVRDQTPTPPQHA